MASSQTLPDFVRGDHTTIDFEFPAGALADIAKAVFSAKGSRKEFSLPALIAGNKISIDLTPAETAEEGWYRADLEVTTKDGKTLTPWLAGFAIVPDVTRG